MGKLQKFVNNQKKELKGLLYNYTVTLLSVAIFSILFSIIMDADNINILENILIFIGIFSVGAIFIETFFIKRDETKSWKKLSIFYVINGIVSLIWTLIIEYQDNIFSAVATMTGSTKDIVGFNIEKIFAMYLITLIVLTMYKMIKKSGLSIGTYIARTCFGLLKIWGLFLTLYFAIWFLLLIFDTLILNIKYWEFMEHFSVLLAGFLYFPYSLLTISNTDEENSKFTKGFVNFVLMPCVIAAIIIVYIYIFKIIFTLNMPENEVFDICINVFIIGGPVWLMSYDFIKDSLGKSGKPLGIYGKIVKNIKYIYSPLIVLEIIALGIRIGNYGLTNERYLGIVAIVFQIIYVIWDFVCKMFKRKHLEEKNAENKQEGLLIVGLVLIAVTLVCPVLNMDKLPYLLQKARFEGAIEKEDYIKASGSYEYLRYDIYGTGFLKNKYTETERKELAEQFNKYSNDEDNYNYNNVYVRRYVTYDDQRMGVNVKGYTNFYPFDYSSRYSEVSQDNIEKICISYANGNCEINVDISDLVDMCIGDDIEFADYNYYTTMDYEYIVMSPNCAIAVEEISFRCNVNTREISDLDINGYVLINEEAHNGQ